MRDLKFRAWDNDNKVFLKPEELLIRAFNGAVLNWNKEMTNNVIIQQFTGLLDKSGKEIYEGDIVNTTARGVCKIIWNDNENAFRLEKFDELPLSLLRLEVIGNVFENPELLN